MKRVYHHILFWVFCLALDVYVEVSWMNYYYLQVPIWRRLVNSIAAELLLMPVKIPVIYISFFIIGKYAIDKKKYVKAASLLVLLFSTGAMISHLLLIKIIFPHIYHDTLFRPIFSDRIMNSLIDLVFIASIANAAKQYRYQAVLKDQERSLIQEKLTAELRFLQAQLNPHFLFNTLNSLYALARRKSDQTTDVILKLSSLLRFILYEADKKYIPVSQEILILENYIELERIRYDEKLSILFEKKLEAPDFSITPLLLLPFIENAFKHGAAETRNDSFIHIRMELKQNGQFLFDIKNNTENELKEIQENIGLKNVRRQLELLYPDHQLIISATDHLFHVYLSLTLTNDEKL
jgi:sensor histidine kinase YesM